jgi:hypothetical protein
MAANKILPSTIPVLTTGELTAMSTGPIPKIMESVATQSVAIDIRNLEIQVVPDNIVTSVEFELGVTALSANLVKDSLGKLVGGMGFLYLLEESRHLKGYFVLQITSLIGPLQVVTFAKRLQAVSQRINIYVEGNLATAL